MSFKFILFLLLLILVSCGKTTEQELDSAKQEAMHFLSKSECADAKKALDDVGYQSDDAHYISLYASVYGCNAGYGELTTALPNLASLGSNATSLYSSLAAFSSSNETAADSAVYTNLLAAINIITSSGGGSASGRNATFGLRKAGDLNLQALLLITVAQGKYAAFYGDAGTDGEKAGGAQLNTCLADYTDNTAVGYITGAGGTCTGADSSLPDLDTTHEKYIDRLCEGVILFNNFSDILSNLSFSTNSGELGSLTSLGAIFTVFYNAATLIDATAITRYRTAYTVASCKALAALDSNSAENLQRFYALLIENAYN